jgi:hypothetical protein
MARTFTTLTLDDVAELLGWGRAEVEAELRDQRRAALRADQALGAESDPELLAQIAADQSRHPNDE